MNAEIVATLEEKYPAPDEELEYVRFTLRFLVLPDEVTEEDLQRVKESFARSVRNTARELGLEVADDEAGPAGRKRD